MGPLSSPLISRSCRVDVPNQPSPLASTEHEETKSRRAQCNAERHPMRTKTKTKVCTNPCENAPGQSEAKTKGMGNSIVLERAVVYDRELIVIVAILGQASIHPGM